MNRLFFMASVWVILLVTLAPSCVFAAWFDTTWHYRVPVVIPATATVNSTIKIDVDFNALLTSLSATGTFDSNSPRVVRPNDTLSATQQYTDSVYAGATDALGNGRGEIRFILQEAGPVTYFLYFDVTSSGLKAANPQLPINGNFEFGTVAGASPQIPVGWLNATRSNAAMDAQMRPVESPTVIDQTTVTSNGNPNTGLAAYLQGFRTATDAGGNAVLTKSITIPASNPGNITIRIRPQGWDSGQNANLTQYDFMQVRLLSGGAVKLNIVGPALNNYLTCPFSPNYSVNGITAAQPGWGQYNYWDNGSGSNNHTLGMPALYNRGLEPWITCTANLTAVAGQVLTLEIRSTTFVGYRSWFLVDDLEWSVVSGVSLGAPIAYFAALAPANFNCVEVGGNSASGHLYTKLVATSFNFDVVALKADGSVESNYVVNPLPPDPNIIPTPTPVPVVTKPVTVELVEGSGSTACASRNPLSPAISQVLTFTASDLGRKAVSAINVGKAFANVRCRVTDANQSPSVVGCSADNFAIRPSAFTAVTSTATADLTGNSVSASPPIIKAGLPFTLTAASGTVGYNGTPLVDNSKLLAHAGSMQAGSVSGSFTAANIATGTVTAAMFNYSEVGYFRFAVNGIYDDGFTAVDSGTDCTPDFSNSLNAGKYGCKFGNNANTAYFGRFIPDHFALTPGVATPACNASYTYFGQDGFSTAFTLSAQNAANAVTQNYIGSFARLGLNAWANFGFTAPGLPAGSVLSASVTPPIGLWNNGSAALSAKHKVSRPTALIGETPVTINAAPVDLDGVTMTASTVAATTPLRYGRIALQNAHGSELLDLPMAMHAEYWNGNNWIVNNEDVCTTGIPLTLADPISGDGLMPTELCAWDNGSTGNSGLGCAIAGSITQQFKQPPTAGNFNLNFKTPGVGNSGALDVTAAVPNYLKYNWKGLGDVSPSARATFGVYKGSVGVIYFREVY
ncbi:MAG: hypothetical protein HOP02_08060 [Methylococcaceae bacterium]|nr:hypothetical protein [Methylococcaceae bacterium]